MKRRYEIDPELNIAATITKAEKAAARAAKKGLGGGYTVTVETETVTEQTEFGQVSVERKFLVIEGDPVAYAGWTFVATVEWVNGQSVVTGSPFYEGEQVDRAALVEGFCDECRTVRPRTKVIVVEDAFGARKQVGTRCVKDFLGQEVTASWYATTDPFAEFGEYSGEGLRYWTVETLLTVAALIVQKSGFVRSQEPGSTIDTVRQYLGVGPAVAVAATRKEYGPLTDEAAEFARRAFDFGVALEGTSDYVLNLQAVLAGGWLAPVAQRHEGLVVSVAGVLLRQEKVTAEAPEVTEALYAPKGTKVSLKGAVVTKALPITTAYGYATVFEFVAEGYRFKWLTSSDASLEVGQVIDLQGTVKGEDTFRGQVSTALLRVKAA